MRLWNLTCCYFLFFGEYVAVADAAAVHGNIKRFTQRRAHEWARLNYLLRLHHNAYINATLWNPDRTRTGCGPAKRWDIRNHSNSTNSSSASHHCSSSQSLRAETLAGDDHISLYRAARCIFPVKLHSHAISVVCIRMRYCVICDT